MTACPARGALMPAGGRRRMNQAVRSQPITSLKVMRRYSMAVILVVPGLASAAADV
jgi:hypothetical protein